MLLALMILAGSSGGQAQREASVPARTRSFVGAMLGESHDLRRAFYGSVTNLDALKSNGLCLVVHDGSLDRAKRVSINECPTVQTALEKCGVSGIPAQPQIRVVQRNRVLQSEFSSDPDSKKEILSLKLSAADVIIMARRQL
jgi:hypothetical protein